MCAIIPTVLHYIYIYIYIYKISTEKNLLSNTSPNQRGHPAVNCWWLSSIEFPKTIPTWLVKDIRRLLSPFIMLLFKKSLAASHFPAKYKHAIISPLLKKSAWTLSNWRTTDRSLIWHTCRSFWRGWSRRSSRRFSTHTMRCQITYQHTENTTAPRLH